jgi:hypothetical protein
MYTLLNIRPLFLGREKISASVILGQKYIKRNRTMEKLREKV